MQVLKTGYHYVLYIYFSNIHCMFTIIIVKTVFQYILMLNDSCIMFAECLSRIILIKVATYVLKKVILVY